MRTIGVEEEYLLVGDDGRPMGVGAAVVAVADEATDDGPGGQLETELKAQMLETGTRPCEDLGDLLDEIRAGRRRATEAGSRVGARPVALGTFPLRAESTFTPVERYREIGREFALTARENLTCGCHVHVGVESDEEGVAVLDRISPWLPVLLALASNSPFWQGEDSGYQSYRSQVWNRWPTAGPSAAWGDPETYHGTVQALVDSGAILDPGMVYFDARLSATYPTVEVRVADVCLRPEDAALVAALSRALVETAAQDAARGVAPLTSRDELLRAATWRAGRSGLTGDLVSPLTFRPVPAWTAVTELTDHVRPALEATGDLDTVTDLLVAVRHRGTGAQDQLAWMARRGEPRDVVEEAARVTAATSAHTA